jgi:hypothetical protein
MQLVQHVASLLLKYCIYASTLFLTLHIKLGYMQLVQHVQFQSQSVINDDKFPPTELGTTRLHTWVGIGATILLSYS